MEIFGTEEGVQATYQKFVVNGLDEVAASNLVIAAQLARIEIHLSEVHNQLKGLSQTLTDITPSRFAPK